MKKSRPLKKFFLAVLILLIIAVILIGIDFYQNVFIPYAGYNGDAITINIAKGSSVSGIARLLHQNKIIPNYHYFRIYYRLLFNDMSFKTGEYKFERAMTMKGVIEKLHKGIVLLHKVTIKEGLIINEIAEVWAGHRKLSIDAAAFIRLAKSPRLIQSLDPESP
jgi:UPF0755 protein